MRSQTETTRVVFFTGVGDEYYEEKAIKFTWHMGMSWLVKQRSSLSLREKILALYPNRRIIEVSTASDNYELGKKLSAFNLTLNDIPVENLFQGSKKFNDKTGPYTDIYYGCSPKMAKQDPRIKARKGHDIIGFELRTKELNMEFGTFPYSAFYDYVYINALSQHTEIAKKILDYDTFTDINFNQKVPYSDKGPFNCQARSLAIYTRLIQLAELDAYISNPFAFFERIYRFQNNKLLF